MSEPQSVKIYTYACQFCCPKQKRTYNLEKETSLKPQLPTPSQT